MRHQLLLLVLAVVGMGIVSSVRGESATSALGALKLIPKDKVSKLARIEARDGTPEPDRWHVIVYDPAEATGLHEFVVAEKEVVASRGVSQFAETIKPEEVIGGTAVKIDSDRVAKLARQYAQTNNVSISKINYELKKDGAAAVPMWKVTCVDENDTQVGELLVTAGKGSVISHNGFAVEPQATPAPVKEKKQRPTPKFDVFAESQVAPGAPSPTPLPGTTTTAATAAASPSLSPGTDLEYETHVIHRRTSRDDDRRGNPVGDAARSVGRTIRRFMPF